MAVTADEMAGMLQKVIDSALPASYRRSARRLTGRLPNDYLWVGERLKEMAADYAASADYADPTTDLIKCVPLATVHEHMTEPRWRTVDVRAFQALTMSRRDPMGFVRSTIPLGTTVLPPPNSWLLDPDDLGRLLSLPSMRLAAALELGADRRPPFVIFRFSVARMIAAGIQIRTPNALDAAAVQQPQWNPSGLSVGREYLDRAVPIEAVEELVWRP